MKNMVEALYAELWEELTGWCRSMAGDRTLAEELRLPPRFVADEVVRLGREHERRAS